MRGTGAAPLEVDPFSPFRFPFGFVSFLPSLFLLVLLLPCHVPLLPPSLPPSLRLPRPDVYTQPIVSPAAPVGPTFPVYFGHPAQWAGVCVCVYVCMPHLLPVAREPLPVVYVLAFLYIRLLGVLNEWMHLPTVFIFLFQLTRRFLPKRHKRCCVRDAVHLWRRAKRTIIVSVFFGVWIFLSLLFCWDPEVSPLFSLS